VKDAPITREVQVNRYIVAAAASALLAVANAAPAQQVYPYARPNYGPYYQPRLSPYLDLLRGGNTPGNTAANYFLGTIPEFERRSNQRYVQNQLQTLEQRPEQPPTAADDIFSPLAGTGHGTAFGNLGGYFNQSNPRINAPPPQSGGAAPARRR
jgi:hypothetical protein